MMRRNREIGVVGGGTSGYLTALTLSKLMPGVKVTLLESSKIPVIGVGESTTPKLLRMLHHVLGFDLAEFYREVQPTWKLGVRYVWGLPGDYAFNNALGNINPFLSTEVSGDINYNSLNSVLMNHDKSFLVETGNKEKPYKSLALPHSYAYHLDNERLVAYLRKKAEGFGVNRIDTLVSDVKRGENGDIEELVIESGERLSFDFYVDCTGFRSLLLGKTMEVPFSEYKSSLFTDTALTGSTPHNGVIKPYTEARTMNNGWQWNIPMQHTDHVGYVFSSAFSSLEDAENELRALHPELGDVKTIRFRSGRHRDFVSGNVGAVGNSYGFIEALQSTALHMVITNVYALVLHLKSQEEGEDRSASINENLGEIWDRLRWFIAINFKFNKKLDTAFWKACRSETDVSGAEELLELYKRRGPLYTLKNDEAMASAADRHQIYGLFSHDFMLLAQNVVPDESPFSVDDKERKHWLAKYGVWDQLAAKALSQSEVLNMVQDQPEILEFDEFFDSPFILDGELDLFKEANIAEFIVKS